MDHTAAAVTYDYRADPILGAALRYWQRKRGGRLMPARHDIDPTEIPKLLPRLQMVDVVDHGARFRYRLVGTAVVETFGQDCTGRYIDEQFSGPRRDFVHKIYRTVCDERRPIFLCNDYKTAKGLAIVAIRMFLPLSEDGEHVNIIIAACKFEFERGAHTGMWGSAMLDGTRYHLEMVDPACSAAA